MAWLKTILVIVLVFISLVGFIFNGLWYPGITPHQSANIIINDSKFGNRAAISAKFFGDDFLKELKIISNEYEYINHHNAFGIARVINEINTSKSLDTAYELYASENIYAKLTGALVLAKKNNLPTDILKENGVIENILYNPLYIKSFESLSQNSQMIRLSLMVVSANQDTRFTNHALDLIRIKPAPFWIHVEACNTLATLKAKDAVPVLIESMSHDKFYAIESAFLALVEFDEDKAITAAIARIRNEPDDYNLQNLVTALENHTGQSFGLDRDKWLSWYQPAK